MVDKRTYFIRISVSLLVLLNVFSNIVAFNLDTSSTSIFRSPIGLPIGEKGAFFGYSVGIQHRAKDDSYWLLVGAPRANSSHPSTPADLIEPGALYTCNVGGDTSCTELLLDTEDNDAIQQQYKPLRDHGWLGAAIDTQTTDRAASAACAPRWTNQLDPKQYLMNGACYWFNSELQDETAHKKLPLLSHNQQTYYNGSDYQFYYSLGQAGMAVHFPHQSSEMLLGAPGVFNWQGSVVLLRDFGFTPTRVPTRKRRQVNPNLDEQLFFTQSFVPNPFFTEALGDSDLFGYSVSSGTFIEKGETYYVAGAPRGAQYLGKVLVFQMEGVAVNAFREYSPLMIVHERIGNEFGEYFGASVAAPDLNNDGFSELVVGAPMNSAIGGIEAGAVYIYRSTSSGQLETTHLKLTGSRSERSRFGSSVISPGDLNLDRYNDLIIGAPFEDNGQGAVYVYLGSPEGVRKKYSQRITSDTPDSGIPKGFGISLSRGRDVDNNMYNDVVIGSLYSGEVSLLRTRPVVNLEGYIVTSPAQLSLHDKLFYVTACLKFNGQYVPTNLDVAAQISLDESWPVGTHRAQFTESGTHIIDFKSNLQRKVEQCKKYAVKINPEINNAPESVAIKLNYFIIDKSSSDGENSVWNDNRLPPLKYPVTDPDAQSVSSSLLSFITGCEADNDPTCTSDLKVSADFSGFNADKPFIIGSLNRVALNFKIQNFGEPAFVPNMTVTVPKPLDLHIQKNVGCSHRRGTENITVFCQLNNPITSNSPDDLSLLVDVSRLTDQDKSYNISIFTGSSSVEVSPGDNLLSKELFFMGEAYLQLYGGSSQDQVLYELQEDGNINTTNPNRRIQHTYTLIKTGPTPVSQTELRFKVPMSYKRGDKFLRLFSFQGKFQDIQFPCSVDKPILDIYDDKMTKDDILTEISCRNADVKCMLFRCPIPLWPKGASTATLTITYDLDLQVISKWIVPRTGLELKIDLEAEITSLKYLTFGGDISDSLTLITYVMPRIGIGERLAWFWILLAIVVGLGLLGIIGYGLHKLGFFQRPEHNSATVKRSSIIAAEEQNELSPL